MLELYINNRKTDLTENAQILLTYKGVETDKPTAQRNTFSKTIELRGTDNNNAVFSDIWKLDSVTNSFNARKRVPASIYRNGEIVEDGYVKLDEIKRDGSEGLSYSITFFGGLGDFFYSLQYDENDNPLTLADIFPNDSITWNAQYVYDAWFPANEESRKLIIPAPVYSGLYEDFDNNKALIDYSSLTQQERDFIGAATITVDDVEYAPYEGRWVMAELPRDCDEWEMNALYAQNLRPSIRLRSIINAIVTKAETQGFNITLPEDAIINKYLDNGYVVLGRLTPKNYDYVGAENVELSGNSITLNGSATIDNSDGRFNTLELSVSPQINITVEDINNYPSSVSTVANIAPSLFGFWKMTVMCYRVRFGSTDSQSSESENPEQTSEVSASGFSKVYAFYSAEADETNPPTYLLNDYIVKAFGLSSASEIIYRKVEMTPAATSIVGGNDVVTYAPSEESDNKIIVSNIPHSSSLTLTLEHKEISIDVLVNNLGKVKETKEVSEFYVNNLPADCTFLSYLSGIDSEASYLYSGNVSPTIEPQQFKTADILGATKSPYEYLIGLTRLFGLKYVYDIKSKTISIMRRTDFYNGETVDISSLIDYGREINVKPSVAASKYYECSLDTPKTHAREVYSRMSNDRQGRPYGALLYNTGYEFNADTTQLFDTTVYQSVIPYRHNSVYFNRQTNISPIFNPKTTTYKYFKSDGDTSESTEFVKYGVSATNNIDGIYDKYTKLCFFDENDKNVTEITNALVFFDGYDIVSESDAVTVYNAVPEMITLNDNPCHLIIGHGQWTAGSYYFKTNYIPRFSKTFNAEISWDFDKPKISLQQLGGGNIDDYTENITISKRFWRDYLDDLYHIDGKTVECYVNLSEIVVGRGEPRDLMRYFYWFGGSLWVLNEIADYDIDGNGLVKCQFIKVYDTENYRSTPKQLIEQGQSLTPVINEDTGEIEYEEEAGGKGFDFDEPETPDYLCFTANTAGSTVGIYNNGNNDPDVEYSTDGTTWTTMQHNTPITLSNVGDKMYVRGNNPNGFSSSDGNSQHYTNFVMSGQIAASGNVMSLIDTTNFDTLTTIPNGSCFVDLFENCSSLVSAPSLPATTLISGCYASMFVNCTSLTAAPSLPATTLAQNCYGGMFEGCTSLTAAPTLPATTLETWCYAHMFHNCTNLNYIKAMFTSFNVYNSTIGWVSGVAATGTFVKNPDAEYNPEDYRGLAKGIPAGWTVLDGRV